MTHPTDEELDALVEYLRDKGFISQREADAITTLRAQLAQADAMIEAQAKDHAENNIRLSEMSHRVSQLEGMCMSGQGEQIRLAAELLQAKIELAAANALADRAEAERAAQIEADDLQPFHFDRYINGVLMAEGVTINKEPTIDSAMMAASRIASKGPNGEVPVLVYRAQPHDRSALDRMLAEVREKALREAADMFDADSNIAQTIRALIEKEGV